MLFGLCPSLVTRTSMSTTSTVSEEDDELLVKPSISAMSSRRPSYAAEFSTRTFPPLTGGSDGGGGAGGAGGGSEFGFFGQSLGLWPAANKGSPRMERLLMPRQVRSQSFSVGQGTHASREEEPGLAAIRPPIYSQQRSHSFLSEGSWSTSLRNSLPGLPILEEPPLALPHSPTPDDYICTTEGMQLFLVEFKSTRMDVFYLPDLSSLHVQLGDLVIVEADRGRDLGKVVRANITSAQVRAIKIKQAHEQHQAMMGSPSTTSTAPPLSLEETLVPPFQPKIIHRLAQPAEIGQLTPKAQMEAEAVQVCATKVRARRLPMEVVDAEYQWDRRKLTFYYTASQRIDFRELVKDLFKIYKTRIWMCATSHALPAHLPREPPLPPGARYPVSSPSVPRQWTREPNHFLADWDPRTIVS